MCGEQRPLGLITEEPAKGAHWSDATEVHSVVATRYRDGHWRLSYVRVDARTRRALSEDLGDVCADCAAQVEPDQILLQGAATLSADREDDRLLR